jgi:hypothetical protein
MTEILQQKIQEELIKLPIEKQRAINSVDWEGLTQKIGSKFLLTDEEIEKLQVETIITSLGFVDFNVFELNIENNVGTSKDLAHNISIKIFEKVFTPIANEIESLIKNNLGSKNIKWDQRVDFIVSGGDYSFFMEK